MPRMQFGDKMPSSYLEIFKPVNGAATRFAILDVDMLIATKSHWVETPRGTKGMFECQSSLCCQSGLFKDGPISYYALPMWVYLNPPNPQTGNPGSSDGILKVFRMPASLYDTVVTLSSQMDLLSVDFLALGVPAGTGVKVNLFPAQGAPILTREIRQQMISQMGDVAHQLERALNKPCSEADWMTILAEYAGSAQAQAAHGNQPAALVNRANPVQMFGGQQPAQQIGQKAGVHIQPQGSVPGQQPVRNVTPPVGGIPGMGQKPSGFMPPPAGITNPMGQQPQQQPRNFGAPQQQMQGTVQPPVAGTFAAPKGFQQPQPAVGYPPQQSYAQPQFQGAEVVGAEVMSEDEMSSMLGEVQQ